MLHAGRGRGAPPAAGAGAATSALRVRAPRRVRAGFRKQGPVGPGNGRRVQQQGGGGGGSRGREGASGRAPRRGHGRARAGPRARSAAGPPQRAPALPCQGCRRPNKAGEGGACMQASIDRRARAHTRRHCWCTLNVRAARRMSPGATRARPPRAALRGRPARGAAAAAAGGAREQLLPHAPARAAARQRPRPPPAGLRLPAPPQTQEAACARCKGARLGSAPARLGSAKPAGSQRLCRCIASLLHAARERLRPDEFPKGRPWPGSGFQGALSRAQPPGRAPRAGPAGQARLQAPLGRQLTRYG